MSKVEQQVMLKLLKDNKEMKNQLDYLVESQELLVDILTELVKQGR